MMIPKGVILLDSLGDVKPENTQPVLVCGSHCGGNRDLAKHIGNCNVKAVFLNNAGIGKNNAGIAGLPHYEAEDVLACAVDRNSAEIGIAQDTWDSGVITHTTSQAKQYDINIGDSVQVAVQKLQNCGQTVRQDNANAESNTTDQKVDLKKQVQVDVNGLVITVTDSITFLNKDNAGDIVVCGSHGGMSAGHYAQKHGVKAVFFNDAGIGKNNAGVKSLDSLTQAGILACTVNCMSAEIFNGKDALENGIVSVCNQLAKHKSIAEGISVREALHRLK